MNKATERQLPQSDEAERGLLGSILLLPDRTLELCADRGILPVHFFAPGHGMIFSALFRMAEAKKTIDLITLTNFLRDDGQLEQIGGYVYLTELIGFVPTAAAAEFYIDILREKWILREIIRLSADYTRRAYENEDARSLLDSYQRDTTALALDDNPAHQPVRHIKEGILTALETIEKAFLSRGRTQGLPTGFVRFDRMTSGLMPGQMIVIGGSTSMGKSSLAMNIAEHVALAAKSAVGVFSLEMSYDELSERLVGSHARVSMQKWRDGFLGDRDSGREEIDRISKASLPLLDAPIYLDDTPALQIFQFKARSRRMVARLGVKLIIVDYLQLMKGESRRSQDNRVHEITEITNAIKNTARELKIPILVLAQLNRDPDKRPTGKPRRADLRESGSIEMDADIVGLVWRPEVFSGDEADAGIAKLLLVKQRNGPVGDIDLVFLKELTRFENPAGENLYSNNPVHRQQQ